MALREILLPWDSQPQEAVALQDWLSADLLSLNAPNTLQPVPFDLTSRQEGQVLLFNGARYWSAGYTPNTSEITLVVIAAQGTSSGQFLASSCAVAGDDGIEFLCSASGQTQLRINTSGTAQQTSTAATGLNDGKAHVFVASWRSGQGANYWVDGRLIATTAALSGTLNSTQPLYLGRRGSTYMSANGGYGLLMASWSSAAVGEALGPVMVSPSAAFAAMYEPRRIPLLYTSAAPTLPTLSAATYVPGSLTASGFRPRVTATY